MQSPGQLRTWSQLSCWSKPPTLWQQPQKLLYMRSPVPLWSLCVSRSLFSDGNYLLFLNVSFQPCYLSHIPRLFKSHPSFFVLNSQILMPFYVWFFFYMKMCTPNIHFYFADDQVEMYRIYASDKFGIQIQTFWVYSTALIFWLISLSCDFALGSAETFAVLTYRL